MGAKKMLKKIKKFFFGNKKQPKNLKEMFDAGFLSKEEFLRFGVTQQQAILEKAKKELAKFLKKGKK